MASLYFTEMFNFPTQKETKGSFGYYSHQSQLVDALNEMKIETSNKNSKYYVHITTLSQFKRVKNKINIVYTMWEFETLSDCWIKKLKEIDYLIVPCQHNKKIFKKYTNIPIFVCQEGCNSNFFTYKKRQFSEPFVWLYVGAWNLRKGIFWVAKLWEEWKKSNKVKNTKLYIKTNNSEPETIKTYADDSIVDNRILNKNELLDIYHNSHAFLFPSMGEGFGLTLQEAISTGLPAVYSDCTAMKDYMSNEIGYPVPTRLNKVTVQDVYKIKNKKIVEIFETQGHNIYPYDALKQMYVIYSNYNKALEKGYAASKMIKNKYSWRRSAEIFVDIIKKIIKMEAKNG